MTKPLFFFTLRNLNSDMKYIILLLKLGIFSMLLMIRLGEWDISGLYARSKYREAYAYYIEAIAGLLRAVEPHRTCGGVVVCHRP